MQKTSARESVLSSGYKDENTFHATVAKWGGTGYLPQDDVQQLSTRQRKTATASASS